MYCSTVNELGEHLQTIEDGLVLIYAGEKGFNYTELKPHIQSDSIQVFGGMYPAIFSETKLHYTGFIVQYFAQDSHVILDDYSSVPDQAANSLIQSGSGIVMVDGLAINNQQLIDDLFYSVGSRYTFLGGGAGSLTLKQVPCIFDQNDIYSDKALLVLLDADFSLGVKHGYERVDGPFIASNGKMNKMETLNWGKPLDLYSATIQDKCGDVIDPDDFFSGSMKYPLGISRKGQEDIVRDPISCGADGSITCINELPENAALYLLKGSKDKLIAAATEAAEQSVSKTDKAPSKVLLVDCVSRVLYLDEEFEKEITGVSNVLHSKFPDIVVEGILSLGEVSAQKHEQLEIHNKTCLVGVNYA